MQLPSFIVAFLILPTIILAAPLKAVPRKASYASAGNIDLSNWELQMPYGSPGSPTVISASELSGYEDPGREYFFNESGDGALVMKVPGSPSSCGCVTTPNSKHCRTELREVSPRSWSPNSSVNRMKATLAVTGAGGGDEGVVIGQVHMDDSVSSKPVCELYYASNGDIHVGVEQTRSGGDEVMTYLANVPKGETFSYEIDYSDNVLKIGINGEFKTLSTYSLGAPMSYFKAGNYNQGDSATDVHFYSLTVEH